MVLDDSSGANIEITCARPPSGPKDTIAKDGTQPGGFDQSARKDHRLIGWTKEGCTVDLTGVDVGSVVKVRGGIGCFRGEKQMTLERLSMYCPAPVFPFPLRVRRAVVAGEPLDVPLTDCAIRSIRADYQRRS